MWRVLLRADIACGPLGEREHRASSLLLLRVWLIASVRAAGRWAGAEWRRQSQRQNGGCRGEKGATVHARNEEGRTKGRGRLREKRASERARQGEGRAAFFSHGPWINSPAPLHCHQPTPSPFGRRWCTNSLNPRSAFFVFSFRTAGPRSSLPDASRPCHCSTRCWEIDALSVCLDLPCFG